MTVQIPSGERVPLDSETVAALVADQFPAFAGMQVRPVDHSGWDNHTFRLGSKYKVRLPASRVYLPQVIKETTWLPRLSEHLPFKVPLPVAVGRPGRGYPFDWSIWEWLDGEPASSGKIADLSAFAEDVACFLRALSRCNTSGGPRAGADNFFRGGDLAVYDRQVRACLDDLAGMVDAVALTQIWEEALSATWEHPPLWVHGDIAWGNLLVKQGKLHAVIDFGSAAIGDPACDLVICWTMFDTPARERFCGCYHADNGTWARARGWCIWKAMLILVENPDDLKLRTVEIATLSAVLNDRETPRL